MLKIAIISPIHTGGRPGFIECLGNMIAHTAQAEIRVDGAKVRHEIKMFVSSSASISGIRNFLLNEALNWGAGLALWADSDQVFPPESLLRLAAHDKAIVGCNYPQREYSDAPSALGFGPGGEPVPLRPSRGLEEVYSIGLGLCLMRTPLLHVLRERAERDGRHLWPLFKESWSSDGNEFSGEGEDKYFCGRLREAGIPVYCDHDLEIGHISDTVLKLRRGHVTTRVHASAGAK